ncbi:MAG TPA: zf-TFIIB domain-containing protein [Candidatus Saccharimonadales bacterium]|nr:zf-TFIIB domain-containing protein [Candidatus Saccharimonadales bacterium]
MKCPNDNTTLVISERQNIEIDYCPECRGVWLDRGELDKLIDRSAVTPTPAPTATVPTQQYQQPYNSHDDYKHHDYNHQRPHHKKKKESFLGDIFDF